MGFKAYVAVEILVVRLRLLQYMQQQDLNTALLLTWMSKAKWPWCIYVHLHIQMHPIVIKVCTEQLGIAWELIIPVPQVDLITDS